MSRELRPPHREQSAPLAPPDITLGIWDDIRTFFLQRPKVPTRIDFASTERQADYADLIRQRLGISVGEYEVLNIHRIGIEAPVADVFEELLTWNGRSTCWPSHLAPADHPEDHIEDIEIHLFGRRWPGWSGKGRFGVSMVPLFQMHLVSICREPDPLFDNARYLLFECSGGYPIGIFAMYVRSPIADLGEVEPTQLFFGVGFDFFGRKIRPPVSPLKWTWQAIHDRVTANVLNRFKQLCEWRFAKTRHEV
ncbi:MAG: hypothetical protein JSV95_05270 [Gemmatimonadota bacterium]|nr:MAG: hypothetical protein JSV95_05270 [Gemmatimonadota bacterium]